MALTPRVRTQVIGRRTPDTTAAAVSMQKSIAGLSGAFDTFFAVKTKEDRVKREAKAFAENNAIISEMGAAVSNPENKELVNQAYSTGDFSQLVNDTNDLLGRKAVVHAGGQILGKNKATARRGEFFDFIRDLPIGANTGIEGQRWLVTETEGMSLAMKDGYHKQWSTYSPTIMNNAIKQRRTETLSKYDSAIDQYIYGGLPDDDIEFMKAVETASAFSPEGFTVAYPKVLEMFKFFRTQQRLDTQMDSMNPRGIEIMINQAEQGEGVAKRFHTQEEVDDWITHARETLDAKKSNKKIAGDIANETVISTSKRYQSGREVENYNQVLANAIANNTDGKMDDIIEDLRINFNQQKIYRDLSETSDKTLIGLKTELEKTVQSRRPSREDELYLDAINDEFFRRQSEDVSAVVAETTVEIDNNGKVSDPAALERLLVKKERKVGRTISPYTSDDVDRMSHSYNSNLANRQQQLAGIITSVTPNRLPKVIRSVALKNPDMALALIFQSSKSSKAQQAGNLLHEGAGIVDQSPEFGSLLLDEANTRVSGYLKHDKAGVITDTYNRSVKKIYKALAQNETEFRPDIMDRAVELALELGEKNQKFRGEFMIPFEPDMSSSHMEFILQQTSVDVFTKMNNGHKPVIIESVGINNIERVLTEEDLKNIQLVYTDAGIYKVVYKGQIVRKQNTNQLFIFNYRDNAEVLKRGMPLGLTDTNDLRSDVPQGMEIRPEPTITAPTTPISPPEIKSAEDVESEKLGTVGEIDSDPATLRLEQLKIQRREDEDKSLAGRRFIAAETNKADKAIEDFETRFLGLELIMNAENTAGGDDDMRRGWAALSELGRQSVYSLGESKRDSAQLSTVRGVGLKLEKLFEDRNMTNEQRKQLRFKTLNFVDSLIDINERLATNTRKVLLKQGHSEESVDAIMNRTDTLITRLKELHEGFGAANIDVSKITDRSELLRLGRENPSDKELIDEIIKRSIELDEINKKPETKTKEHRISRQRRLAREKAAAKRKAEQEKAGE